MSKRMKWAVRTFVAVAAVSLPVNAFAAPAAANYPKEIGKSEGELNIVAWEGYAQDDWIKPFEARIRLQGEPQICRFLRRDGCADALRRRQLL